MDIDIKSKAGVIKSKTLTECSNYELTPGGIQGPVVVKIPVVIAEPVIQIDVEADINLEEPVLEIKRIKKNVFITQCRLIDTECNKVGKLFISGFVRKNIEYATADAVCVPNKSISGDIKHTTVNVPFTCVTKVHYVTPPQINYQENPKESAFFTDMIKGEDFCGQKISGRYPCEQNFEHFEVFNERVYCELEEVKIFEDDIHKGSKCFEDSLQNERTFDSIIEKMVIYIRLKLLQLQQVSIPGNKTPDTPHKR